MSIRAVAAVMWLLAIAAPLQGRATACELLGFSMSENVSAGHLISALRCRGEDNPDGWGVAIYSDNSAAVFKEAASAARSDLAELLSRSARLKGRLLIAHVRSATVGGQTHQNTHPFSREWKGRQYVLAHNGTLKHFRARLKLTRFKPLGTTDSEHLLCYLVGRIAEQGVSRWDEPARGWLRKELRAINATGSLNCLFSDGTHLFAYHDKDGHNELHYLRRKPPHEDILLKDLGRKIDLGRVYPASAAGVLVATRPLTDESWVELRPGELLVVKDGEPVSPESQPDRK